MPSCYLMQTRLDELEKERDQADMEKAMLEKQKYEAEQPEKEAKERHEKAWEGEWVGCCLGQRESL